MEEFHAKFHANTTKKHSANWSYSSATFTHSAETNIHAKDSKASSPIQTQSAEIYNKGREQSNRQTFEEQKLLQLSQFLIQANKISAIHFIMSKVVHAQSNHFNEVGKRIQTTNQRHYSFTYSNITGYEGQT